VLWHFAAFTAQHRRTWLAVYAVPPMSTVVVTSAGCSINSAHDTRRPRLSCGCSQSMERPAANDQGLAVAADVPPTTENVPFSIHVSPN